MTLQVHPIALGCMLVVAVGTLIYTYMTSRQQEQGHSYGGSSRSRQHDIFEDLPSLGTSRSSSRSTLDEESGQPSRRKKKHDTCTICLAPLKSNMKTLLCKHTFHSHCINMWFNTKVNCPICRKDACN